MIVGLAILAYGNYQLAEAVVGGSYGEGNERDIYSSSPNLYLTLSFCEKCRRISTDR